MIEAIAIEDFETGSHIEIYLNKKHLFNLVEQKGKIFIIPIEGTKENIRYAKMED